MTKKLFIGLMIIVAILVAILLLIKPKDESTLSEGIVVFYSTESRQDSRVLCYDKKGELLRDTKIPYGGMNNFGFNPMVVWDGQIIEAPNGLMTSKDNGIVLAYDYVTGEYKTYDFSSRVNITDYDMDEEYVYALSNLNGITYFDRLEKFSGNVETVEVKQGAAAVILLCVYEEQAYYLISDAGEAVLYQVDFETQQTTEKMREAFYSGDMYGNVVAYNGKIYCACGDRLFSYSVADETVTEIETDMNYTWHMEGYDNFIYVSNYRNSQEQGMKICKVDTTTDTVVETFFLEDCPQMYQIVGDILYAMHSDKLITYKMKNDGMLEKENEFKIGIENYYTNSFYVF